MGSGQGLQGAAGGCRGLQGAHGCPLLFISGDRCIPGATAGVPLVLRVRGWDGARAAV